MRAVRVRGRWAWIPGGGIRSAPVNHPQPPIRSYVFVILLSLSSLVVLGNLMVRMCWDLSQEFEAPNYLGVEIR